MKYELNNPAAGHQLTGEIAVDPPKNAPTNGPIRKIKYIPYLEIFMHLRSGRNRNSSL